MCYVKESLNIIYASKGESAGKRKYWGETDKTNLSKGKNIQIIFKESLI